MHITLFKLVLNSYLISILFTYTHSLKSLFKLVLNSYLDWQWNGQNHRESLHFDKKTKTKTLVLAVNLPYSPWIYHLQSTMKSSYPWPYIIMSRKYDSQMVTEYDIRSSELFKSNHGLVKKLNLLSYWEYIFVCQTTIWSTKERLKLINYGILNFDMWDSNI
jgi:hypothetical protein